MKEMQGPDVSIPANLGSCGLHTVHGAYKAGFKEVKWPMQKVLLACHNFFNDSSARRADFIEITGYSVF